VASRAVKASTTTTGQLRPLGDQAEPDRSRLPTLGWQGPASAPDDRARWETSVGSYTTTRLTHETASPASSFSSTRRRPPRSPIDHRPPRHRRWDGSASARSVPIVLPDPLADLVLKLAVGQRGHATTGADVPRPGCSASASPAADQRPSSFDSGSRWSASTQTGTKQRAVQLAAELPAALLARLLGIDISAAVAGSRSRRRLDDLRRRRQLPLASR